MFESLCLVSAGAELSVPAYQKYTPVIQPTTEGGVREKRMGKWVVRLNKIKEKNKGGLEKNISGSYNDLMQPFLQE